MVIGDIIQFGSEIVSLFQPKEPTPEEQKQKAGVWYLMLQDWEINQPQDANTFGAKWKDRLPFSQTKTKSNFINNNINGKTFTQIENVLIDKINDELTKGGFPMQSKDTILAGMGIGQGVGDTSGGLSVSGNAVLTSPAPLGETENAKESKNFFLFALGFVFVALIVIINFAGVKKKKRS